MDHHTFDEAVLERGTAAILKTRDGKLRAAVPHPLGSCVFINDIEATELNTALRRHKEIMRDYPRNGEGIEAFVDASDTGYTDNSKTEVEAIEVATEKAGSLNGPGYINGGSITNGRAYDVHGNKQDLPSSLTKGLTNGVNGFTNGARA